MSLRWERLTSSLTSHNFLGNCLVRRHEKDNRDVLLREDELLVRSCPELTDRPGERSCTCAETVSRRPVIVRMQTVPDTSRSPRFMHRRATYFPGESGPSFGRQPARSRLAQEINPHFNHTRRICNRRLSYSPPSRQVARLARGP